MSAYLEAAADGEESSSPRMASASLSYHCLRGGGTGRCGDAERKINVSSASNTPDVKRKHTHGTNVVVIQAGCVHWESVEQQFEVAVGEAGVEWVPVASGVR